MASQPMAREIRHFDVGVPAATPVAAPVTTAITFPVRQLVAITWHFPAGCAGLVGFYVAQGGAVVMPLPAGTWIIGDKHGDTWTPTGQSDSGQWQIVAYNTGKYPHVIKTTWHLDLVTRQRLTVPSLAVADLMPVPDLSQAGPAVLLEP